MRKVLVMGPSGAGKSTFARRLGGLTGLPIVYLDQHFWQPGWAMTPPAAWRRKVEALVAQPSWIMDGDYGSSLDLRIPAADTIIYIVAPRWLCLSRVLMRSFRSYGKVREDLAPGCPEQFITWDFFKYVWRYNSVKRPEILARLAGAEEKTTILTGAREMNAYLQKVTTSSE